MNSSLWFLYVAGAVLTIFGLALLVASIVPPWRRGQPVFSTFWAPREMFLGRELMYNRVGFCLSIVGIAMAAYVLLQLGG